MSLFGATQQPKTNMHLQSFENVPPAFHTSDQTNTATVCRYPLPFIGTATDVKLFTMTDNSSNRHVESFKTIITLTFFLCWNMVQKLAAMTAFSANACPREQQPVAALTIRWLSQATATSEHAPNVSWVFSEELKLLLPFFFLFIPPMFSHMDNSFPLWSQFYCCRSLCFPGQFSCLPHSA